MLTQQSGWRTARSRISIHPRSGGRSSARPDDAISSTDLDQIITSWSRAAERLYGYTAAEVIGKSNRLLIPPELYQEEDDVVRRVGGGEGVQHLETTRVRKEDGSRIEVAITAPAIRGDGDDRIIGISKIARDITDRKETERTSARLAAIVESSDGAIVSKDLNGVITTWNSAAERMFGYSARGCTCRSREGATRRRDPAPP